MADTNLGDGGDLTQVWAMALAFHLYPTRLLALLCLLRLICIASSRSDLSFFPLFIAAPRGLDLTRPKKVALLVILANIKVLHSTR
ncbi:IQ-domain [Musa troglodytarum]|uniref:IQ-domain n=1 Tax=Musa troglodytarum TaxID=320322 RepID=A0A9E7F7F8_9LILI|nr:IQ-domain [Musa troglodytarum]